MTIEKIETVWNNFLKRVDQAEQSQFMNIHIRYILLEPLYNDLHENWGRASCPNVY